jgi:hypothetical protein
LKTVRSTSRANHQGMHTGGPKAIIGDIAIIGVIIIADDRTMMLPFLL